MAYNGANLSCLLSPLTGNGPRFWYYTSTDAATAVRVNGYISDATTRGMKAGDIVFSLKSDAAPLSIQIHIVSAVSAAGAADLSDGLAITATNTD